MMIWSLYPYDNVPRILEKLIKNEKNEKSENISDEDLLIAFNEKFQNENRLETILQIKEKLTSKYSDEVIHDFISMLRRYPVQPIPDWPNLIKAIEKIKKDLQHLRQMDELNFNLNLNKDAVDDLIDIFEGRKTAAKPAESESRKLKRTLEQSSSVKRPRIRKDQ